MRVRNGFVSNSSSSSFIIVGERVSSLNATSIDLRKLVVLGESLGDGVDFIRIDTEDELEFCRDNAYLGNQAWFRVEREYNLTDGDLDQDEVKALLKPGEKAYLVEADNHSCRDIEDLVEAYGERSELGYIEI